MSYFYFNGFYSYEMGLIVEEKSIYNGPQPDFELISVPGRDGDVILDHNRFKNVEVSYTVSFIGTKEKVHHGFLWDGQMSVKSGVIARSEATRRSVTPAVHK
ncbi:MAG: hypothetical protein IJK54_02595 [Clostridia bacterium]|nr:hypothetical protein [Clostridia bacterium]